MTAKHTPAPWKIRELTCEDHRGMGWVEDANGRDIACCGAAELWLYENRANARLIAAAPDLLAALNACVAVAKSWHNMGVEDGSPLDVWQIYYDNAPEMKPIRDAIAKATKGLLP